MKGEEKGKGVAEALIVLFDGDEAHQLVPSLFAGMIREFLDRTHPAIGYVRDLRDCCFQPFAIGAIRRSQRQARDGRGVIRVAALGQLFHSG